MNRQQVQTITNTTLANESTIMSHEVGSGGSATRAETEGRGGHPPLSLQTEPFLKWQRINNTPCLIPGYPGISKVSERYCIAHCGGEDSALSSDSTDPPLDVP